MRLLLLVLAVAVAAGLIWLLGLALRGIADRRRIKELDDPTLSLSRRERRERARELLKRERAEYDDARQRELMNQLYGSLPNHNPEEHRS